MRVCRIALGLLLLATPALAASPLEDTWDGTSAGGVTAQVVVEDGYTTSFTWHGKTYEPKTSKLTEGGNRVTFTFSNGSATMKHTAAGADLTVKENGQGEALVHMTGQ